MTPTGVSVAVVDLGAGNVGSVCNALTRLGVTHARATEPQQLHSATHLVLPGVGAFAAFMEALHHQGFVEPLRRLVLEEGRPLLGVCVGMQVLASEGTEFGITPGLGWLPGRCVHIGDGQSDLRVPHMGWNQVDAHASAQLFTDVGGEDFYFVHSYHLVPEDPDVTIATCQYGATLTAAVQRGHIMGVQFHPEKSQRAGLQLLRNFIDVRR